MTWLIRTISVALSRKRKNNRRRWGREGGRGTARCSVPTDFSLIANVNSRPSLFSHGTTPRVNTGDNRSTLTRGRKQAPLLRANFPSALQVSFCQKKIKDWGGEREGSEIPRNFDRPDDPGLALVERKGEFPPPTVRRIDTNRYRGTSSLSLSL